MKARFIKRIRGCLFCQGKTGKGIRTRQPMPLSAG
nr:MAG TPA: hypothetical protein [Caudoviricetes sp.]